MNDAPFTLRSGRTVPGRVALAPLTNLQSEADGTLSDKEQHWLERRAAGGFRWISTCACFVSEEGHAWDGQLGVSSDAHVPGLARLAERLHAHGSTAVVQLHHGGSRSHAAVDHRRRGPAGRDGR